jgi:hypothetical protein
VKHPGMQRRDSQAHAERMGARYTLQGCRWTLPGTVLLFLSLHGLASPPLGSVATGIALLVTLLVAVCVPYQSALLRAELERERLELAQRRQLVGQVSQRHAGLRSP